MSEEEKRILRAIIPEDGTIALPDQNPCHVHRPGRRGIRDSGLRESARCSRNCIRSPRRRTINETMFDLHESKPFMVGDFKVIREDNRNFLVSPYYAKSGGMVIDWITGEESESGKRTMLLRKPKEKDEQAPDAVIGNVQVIKTGSCEASAPEA
jgi:hypothetical protein